VPPLRSELLEQGKGAFFEWLIMDKFKYLEVERRPPVGNDGGDDKWGRKSFRKKIE